MGVRFPLPAPIFTHVTPLSTLVYPPSSPFIVCRALGIERLDVNGDFECMSSTA
jgi:hypothetical protein